MNIAATFGHNVDCLGQLNEVLTGGSVRTKPGKNVNPACVAETARGVLCTATTRRHQKALIRHLLKDHEAEWKLALAASSSTGEESARRGARRRIYPTKKENSSSTILLFLLLLSIHYEFGIGKIPDRNTSSKPLVCSFWYRL